jgi:hypothetical protein
MDRFPEVAEVVAAAAVGIVAAGVTAVGAPVAEELLVADGVPAEKDPLVGVDVLDLTTSREVDAVSIVLPGLPVVGPIGVGAPKPGAGRSAHPANITPATTNDPSIAVQCRPITRPAS